MSHFLSYLLPAQTFLLNPCLFYPATSFLASLLVWFSLPIIPLLTWHEYSRKITIFACAFLCSFANLCGHTIQMKTSSSWYVVMFAERHPRTCFAVCCYENVQTRIGNLSWVFILTAKSFVCNNNRTCQQFVNTWESKFLLGQSLSVRYVIHLAWQFQWFLFFF